MSTPIIERRWQDAVMMVLGLWLLVSPFVLQYTNLTDVASVNSYVLGVAVVIFSAAALNKPQIWEEWVNLLLGIWLIISPFALHFGDNTVARWNHIVLGLLIGIDALWVTLQYPIHKPASK